MCTSNVDLHQWAARQDTSEIFHSKYENVKIRFYRNKLNCPYVTKYLLFLYSILIYIYLHILCLCLVNASNPQNLPSQKNEIHHNPQYGSVIISIILCGMKLLVHSKTSTAQSLKFENGDVISSYSLPDIWLLIHVVLKLNHLSKMGYNTSNIFHSVYVYICKSKI